LNDWLKLKVCDGKQ